MSRGDSCSKRISRWWVYEMPPLDWWFAMEPVEDYLSNMFRPDSGCDAGLVVRDIAEAVGLIAKRTHWECDCCAGFAVVGIPNGECDPALAVCIKQCNNGSTYLACEVELPHLNKYLAKE